MVYLVLFVMAVVSPSIVSRNYFGIPEAQVEEILIFLFGISGLGVFSLYDRLVEKRLKARDKEAENAERAMKELAESYRYIGSLNRHIEVLKSTVNETSLSLTAPKIGKNLMQSLLANAAACAGSHGTLLRFVELEKLRTESEYGAETNVIKIGNKQLVQLHESRQPHAFLRSDDGAEILVVPSDRKDSKARAHLMLLVDSSRITEVELSLLKVFANQAELVHEILKQKDNGAPLDKLDEVTKMTQGEVS